jgi:DNA-directed RNA polymerase specialized sigma24 family protein
MSDVMSESEGSVTRLLDCLRGIGGETDDAAQLLWQRYFTQLVWRARSRLESVRHGRGNEEDVALSAFKSVCIGIANGRFPDLKDRDDLWRLLVVVTARKAINHIRSELNVKHGGGHVVSLDDEALAMVVCRDPTPDDASIAAEEYRRLLALLPDDQFRRIAILKMEGHSDREVAGVLGVGLRTVERKLLAIRKAWREGASAGGAGPC